MLHILQSCTHPANSLLIVCCVQEIGLLGSLSPHVMAMVLNNFPFLIPTDEESVTGECKNRLVWMLSVTRFYYSGHCRLNQRFILFLCRDSPAGLCAYAQLVADSRRIVHIFQSDRAQCDSLVNHIASAPCGPVGARAELVTQVEDGIEPNLSDLLFGEDRQRKLSHHFLRDMMNVL